MWNSNSKRVVGVEAGEPGDLAADVEVVLGGRGHDALGARALLRLRHGDGGEDTEDEVLKRQRTAQTRWQQLEWARKAYLPTAQEI